MDYLKWDESYSVNNKKIDEQHKKLFDQINNLYNAIKMKTEKNALEKTLDDLLDYINKHFSFEESLLKASHYPQLVEHILKHKEFTSQITDFHKKFHKGDSNIAFQLAVFLNRWLWKHVTVEDKKYAPFVSKTILFKD